MHKRLSGLGAAILLAWAGGLSAATFTVINTGDAGAGSLRQAILDANACAARDRLTNRLQHPRHGSADDQPAVGLASTNYGPGDHRRLHAAGGQRQHAGQRATMPCC